MGILCKNALDGIRFTVNFGTPPVPPKHRSQDNPESIIVKNETCTKYMTSVHPSREMTRKMATQARPMLSKEIAPLNGLVGPVVHFV